MRDGAGERSAAAAPAPAAARGTAWAGGASCSPSRRKAHLADRQARMQRRQARAPPAREAPGTASRHGLPSATSSSTPARTASARTARRQALSGHGQPAVLQRQRLHPPGRQAQGRGTRRSQRRPLPALGSHARDLTERRAAPPRPCFRGAKTRGVPALALAGALQSSSTDGSEACRGVPLSPPWPPPGAPRLGAPPIRVSSPAVHSRHGHALRFRPATRLPALSGPGLSRFCATSRRCSRARSTSTA
jgi:hypothetical protein